MKKLMTLILALALTCSLAACGSDGGNSAEDNSGNLAAGPGGSDTLVTMDCEYLYGKITSIVGNEIELALAEMPDTDTPATDGDDSGDTGEIPDGPIAAAPAQAVDPIVGGGENVEYTGETLTLTLPAGVKFYSMGQETTLSALKKGSLVSVVVDNLEDMNIQVIDIMG